MDDQKGQKPAFPATEIDNIMARASDSSQDGPKELRRRGASFTVFPEQCMGSGYITEPIELTVYELDSDGELRGYQSAGGMQVEVDEETGKVDTSGMPQEALIVSMGKQALHSLNGRKLTSDEKATIWELIGMTGRLAAGRAYMEHCTGASEGFLERSLASIKVC